LETFFENNKEINKIKKFNNYKENYKNFIEIYKNNIKKDIKKFQLYFKKIMSNKNPEAQDEELKNNIIDIIKELKNNLYNSDTIIEKE